MELEQHKSELINTLLENHYKINTSEDPKVSRVINTDNETYYESINIRGSDLTSLNPDTAYKPPTERPHALEKVGHTELRKPIKTSNDPMAAGKPFDSTPVKTPIGDLIAIGDVKKFNDKTKGWDKLCKHGADPLTCKHATVKNGVKKCRHS